MEFGTGLDRKVADDAALFDPPLSPSDGSR
jgi:hypothetical protein